MTKSHNENPGARIESGVRDVLAIDRTVLANERTLLAYIRTALTLFIAGLSFVRFFDWLLVVIIGWILTPLGLAVLMIGFVRYHKMRGRMCKHRKGYNFHDAAKPPSEVNSTTNH